MLPSVSATRHRRSTDCSDYGKVTATLTKYRDKSPIVLHTKIASASATGAVKMANPPPGLGIDGVIRREEPYAWLAPALPPTQPLIDYGAVALPGTVALSIGRDVTFPATTGAIGVNADLLNSQRDEAWRSRQAALATAPAQLDAVEAQQAIVATAPPDANNPETEEDTLMAVGLEPPDGITLEQAVVDFPPPIHLPARPWNRVPNGARNTYTVTCMSHPAL